MIKCERLDVFQIKLLSFEEWNQKEDKIKSDHMCRTLFSWMVCAELVWLTLKYKYK